MSRLLPYLLALVLFAASGRSQSLPRSPWQSDQGDGTYRNPVLFADYSDPDAIRVGDEYYLISSSFLAAPGLPILHSRDLVNWTIINHVFALQPPVEHFAKPRHGQGVWAPAIRFHDGKYWITYPDPDFGIYVTSANDPAGEWSEPRLIKAGRGLIDPCPFWDEDGQAYLVHGWAKSRAGIGNLLTLHRIDAALTTLLDGGKTIIDANTLRDWRTLEGPKLYKRNGYYYVFAPAGGVATGYQAVFRAKSIWGPYENRIVLDQGRTVVNGPHQGAWVDTVGGEDWFLHFQDAGAYGRVVHLQPMRWQDDWPVIGDDPDGDGKGEPVLQSAKPRVAGSQPVTAPQTSDEFADSTLGRQWQWNANPQADWASLTARPGHLRMRSVPAPKTRNDLSPSPRNLYDAPNFLLQKFPAPDFAVTTQVQFSPQGEGETAGLAVFGYNYAILGVRREATGERLVLRLNVGADRLGAEEQEVGGATLPQPGQPVWLRATVRRTGVEAMVQFAASFDGQSFQSIGEPFQASVDRWIGAKIGVIATAAPGPIAAGHADFAWFRIDPPGSQ